MSKRVAVLGGGVAGLTVAHELLDCGFHVTLFERRRVPGGKARSYRRRPEGAAAGAHRPLPGEHGFRFFPGFYRHLDDTMRRIPAPKQYRVNGRKTVLDCLVPIEDEVLTVAGHPPISVPAALPRTTADIRNALRLPGTLRDCGLTDEDLATFSDKLWQIATSCPERRNREYERIGWRDFVQSKNRSDEYYWYLASGLTRALVAARARYASTKTMGNVALQLLSVAVDPSQTTDRVLCGPTNDVWISPWIGAIRKRGGKVETATVTGIQLQRGRVRAVELEDGRSFEADYFVSALPVETLSDLVKKSPALRAHRQFTNVTKIADGKGADQCLRKMSGLQIYCRKKLELGRGRPLNKGHQLLLDSPWGLTSIAQGQFWDQLPEGVGDILSIDISSWDMEGLEAGKAEDCSPSQVFEEVCRQVGAAFGDAFLSGAGVLGWNLDSSPEQLLVNRTDSWHLRPKPGTPFGNFKLAGDFVQTETDLACMEGANEAARLAVNEILEQEGWALAERCSIWPIEEVAALRPLQQIDRNRFERGLSWTAVRVGPLLVQGAGAGGVLADPRAAPAPSLASTARAHRPPRSEWDDPTIEPMAVTALSPRGIATALEPYSQYASPGRSDPMFKRWRLYRPHFARQYTVPLHIYDANSLILYGVARNFDRLRQLTKGTSYHPVSAERDGRRVGFAELWILQYNDTSIGPAHEMAVNFVVNQDPDKPRYQWRSSYSALTPMMDANNRLFTPELILQEKRSPGCIEYGNDLFGMNKLRGKLKISPGPTHYQFHCEQVERRVAHRIVPGKPEFAVSGKIEIETSRVQGLPLALELARELTFTGATRNFLQIRNREEIPGALVSRNFASKNGNIIQRDGTIETRAAYKFSPTIHKIEREPLTIGKSPFGQLLREMEFESCVAAHDPHFKSVLYTDDYPSPDA